MTRNRTPSWQEAPPGRRESPAGRVLTTALLRAAEGLDLDRAALGAMLGLSEASMSRLYTAKRHVDPDSKEGELAVVFLRLYRSLDALVGGDHAKARAWMHGENDHLHGTPAELVRTVEGLVRVTEYVDAMRGTM